MAYGTAGLLRVCTTLLIANTARLLQTSLFVLVFVAIAQIF